MGDAENAYPDQGGEAVSPLNDLVGHAISYRITVEPNRGQKALTLQTLPAIESVPAVTTPQASADPAITAWQAAHCG